MKPNLACLGRLAVMLLIFCPVVAAQTAKKGVTVTIEVTDGHGSRIPKAQAEILSIATAACKKLVADDKGTTQLELEPGGYVVIVSSPAFKTVNRHITVDSTESQRFEFALQVGGCPIPDPCPVVVDHVLAPTSILPRTTNLAPYSNSTEGLRLFLNNMLLAAQSDDPSKLQSMIRETEIPGYQSWFTKNFGQETGESWAEPYGRWLAKDEKEFQEFFVKLARMEGEFITQSLDSANTWGSLNGPLDAYRAKWRRRDAPKGEDIVHVGDFYFVEGKFRWFTQSWYDPFQTPAQRSIVPGKVVKKVQPEYPAEAREKKIEGIVKLQVILGKDGSVTVQNVLLGDPGLSLAAIEAVRQWRCEPTLLDGKPIDLETTIEVTFTLKP